MKLLFIMLVVLLTAMTADVADAEWNVQNAKPQPFQVFDDYVIAVGTRDELVPIQASVIVTALQDGKEIRLKCAKIEGNVEHRGNVEQDVYFEDTIFTGGADFESATFSEVAHFRRARFSGGADFWDTTFSEEADFSGALFSKEACFGSIFGGVGFSGEANFLVPCLGARFLGEATFRFAWFSGGATFRFARFSEEVDFRFTTFSEEAHFRFTTFSEVAHFRHARFFEKVDFGFARFSEKVDFGSATFIKGADFSACHFEEDAHFVGCEYFEYAPINFRAVTGFSQMQMEWEYNVDYNVTDEVYSLNEIKRRGLKGHLKYDETFYVALIKNYQDMGWLRQADDAYYIYRKEKRTRRNIFWGILERVVLEIPFGYGVKPWKLLYSFLLFWWGFSWYYVGFLRGRNDDWVLHWSVAWNPRRHRFRCFTWSLLHSLDIITPGIDLHSLASLKRGYIFKEKSKGVIWGERIQKLFGWYLLALFLVMFGKIWVR